MPADRVPGTAGGGKNATFSPCRRWRYTLERETGTGGDLAVAFIGLNPSTADELNDDPTIRRCVDFARRWGYGKLVMLNLFAWRATDPRELSNVFDPRGAGSLSALEHWHGLCDKTIAAWGNIGRLEGRDGYVREILQRQKPLYHLGLTKYGMPRHPLHLKATTLPTLWATP